MKGQHSIRLTAAELTALWTNYLTDTMSICIFKYFLEKVDDIEIKPILIHAMNMSNDHIGIIEKIFKDEGIPIPKGFTDEDVDPNAPRLFHDTFILNYLKHMAKGGMATYSATLPNIIRQDIREYYSHCLQETIILYNETTSILLSKGLEIRPPYIPYPKKVEFLKKQSFLSGWFGEQRPLTGAEITHLYANIQTNKLGEALLVGFGQVAKLQEIREFMFRGKEIAKKHYTVFSNYLTINDLPAPMTWDHEVENETNAPFSEKLMMHHINMIIASGIGYYGASIGACQRRDIIADYARLTAEAGKYAEDGINIMINHDWCERPPHAIDRDELIR